MTSTPCSPACDRVAEAVVTRAGGRIEGEGADRVIVLPPTSSPQPLALEQLADYDPADLDRWSKEFDERKAKVADPKDH